MLDLADSLYRVGIKVTVVQFGFEEVAPKKFAIMEFTLIKISAHEMAIDELTGYEI
jgi:hypothetical protein